MNTRIGIPAALALWAGMAATGAQAAVPTACVSQAEASTLLLAVAPDAIKAAGTACGAVLPPGALIRQTRGPFIEKYRSAADGAWSGAQAALGKLIGDQGIGLDPSMMRPLVSALVVTALGLKIKPADCTKIDRAVTLLAPLPPANAAELFVMFANADGKAGRKGMISLCLAGKS